MKAISGKIATNVRSDGGYPGSDNIPPDENGKKNVRFRQYGTKGVSVMSSVSATNDGNAVMLVYRSTIPIWLGE
ncbi:MAG: hypothetical protein ABJQ90_10845 [Parasphingorhabdus sp.]